MARHMEFGPQGDGTHGFLGYISFGPVTIGKQLTNGSPVNPLVQLQIGLWLTTWHKALRPQVSTQGS